MGANKVSSKPKTKMRAICRYVQCDEKNEALAQVEVDEFKLHTKRYWMNVPMAIFD